MKKDAKNRKKLEGLVDEKDMLKAFAKEFQEYQEIYRELVLIDGISKMRDELALAMKIDEQNPIEVSDTSGLRRSYLLLLEFERRYPFIEQNYSLLAANLPSVGKYLTRTLESE